MPHLNNEIKKLLLEGTVIPAHPLVLKEDRSLDPFRQKRLTKYYLASGARGIAVGVHTTQFAIRDPGWNLYTRVLQLTMEGIEESLIKEPIIKIAGVGGLPDQAVREAELAFELGYDIALLNTNGLANLSEKQLIERAQEVSAVIPIFGFYLQPAVGGRILSHSFWAELATIANLHAIKIAPFNRYQTLDVVQAVCQSSRCDEIALYTGNDDNIVFDLISNYKINTKRGIIEKGIVGGLLGHWAVWTAKAVELLKEVKNLKTTHKAVPAALLSKALQITDSNAAFFDARNNYKGCIAGIHEVLRRQGLIEGIWCLDPDETLSPGQKKEIGRVYSDYPALNDDLFVNDFLLFNQVP